MRDLESVSSEEGGKSLCDINRIMREKENRNNY